ncbi:rod shape-determining protein MreC [Bacillus sp. AGMB 02131]|uniref:Cell shape-determining protein MreC n=1 Tax=Peribacillus faecalis TaxID=2772559 RepID=A0A927CU19_9BACI|nr:rod shape-determining protein MreC [Peribacillus faecalis]MBD3107838.1 rod shape-determining protein MreC [Peribacillus faecalis]
MPQFFLNKKLILLLISIIILVALIGFSLKEKENVSWPEQFVKDTTGFVQQIFQTPAQFVADVFGDLRDLQNTYEENEKLKARLEEYATLQTKVQDLESENEELRSLLDKEDDLRSYSPINATVIARNPDKWQEVLVINKGQLHGVKKNMAVITASGLIGKVKSSNQFSSTIQLISTTDPKSRISATIQGEQDVVGLIEGYDEETKMLLLKKIPSDVEVKVGSTVITSGLGGVFPRGLPVGTVEEVVVDQYGLTQTAYVKPYADLYDISHVVVVSQDVDKKEVLSDLEDADLKEAGL